jgi:acyl-CoA synthetase (AMP-forming)/AMP-acid ligase II
MLDDLHRPLYCADILINALNQDPNRPLLHLLDGPTLTRPGHHVTAEELIFRVAQRKGSFQAPKTVEFIDSIPQTAVGKPDKKALRAKFR